MRLQDSQNGVNDKRFETECTKAKLTLAGVWGRSVLTELEEEQWDPVFVSVPDKRRFLDSGELDICKIQSQDYASGKKEQPKTNDLEI